MEHLDAAGRRQPLTAPRNLCFYLGPARAGEETPSETSKDDDFDAKASKPQDLSEKWDGWPIGAGKDVLQQEEEKEGGQRRMRELTGGGQKVMMVTWMPPVHHITGMSERLWQVAQALVGLGLQVGCRVVDMQAYAPGGSCACTLSLSTLNRHAELAANLRHMGARTEYCARHACD